MVRAWLMLAAGEDRSHGGNEGYDDDPARLYRWDDTVPNHASPAVGHIIAIWNKTGLLGVSVIERIDEGDAAKTRRRCPKCGDTGFKPREAVSPRFRCSLCPLEFDEPRNETIAVHTYCTDHESAWVDLAGKLDASTLRSLCLKPRSQHSLRELDWQRFAASVSNVGALGSLSVVQQTHDHIVGGYQTTIAKTRIGQGRFRAELLRRFGTACAITGPHPLQTLDAAHLYSYAEHEVHDGYGGLLLRKDIHRLFDLGLLCIHPETLIVDVHPDVRSFPNYRVHHGQSLDIDLSERTRAWLHAHWRMHRRDE